MISVIQRSLLTGLIVLILLFFSGCSLLRRRRENGRWQPETPAHPWPERATPPAWPGREDVTEPTVDFLRVLGWSLDTRDIGNYSFSRDADGRGAGTYTGLISLQGVSQGAELTLRPPEPLMLNDPFDTLELWVRGHAANAAFSTQGKVEIIIRTNDNAIRAIELGELSSEWTLLHHRISDSLAELTHHPCLFLGLRISELEGHNELYIYLDNLALYTEISVPLQLSPRPHLNITRQPHRARTLHRGERPLPFPLRSETVRPDARIKGVVQPRISKRADQSYLLEPDAGMSLAGYVFNPRNPDRLLELEWAGKHTAILLAADSFKGFSDKDWKPVIVYDDCGRVVAEFRGGLIMEISLSAASLIVDIENRHPVVESLNPGGLRSDHPVSVIHMPGWTDPELGGPLVAEIRPQTDRQLFLSAVIDPYRTQSATMGTVEDHQQKTGIHPVLHYLPKTTGTRRPLHERIIWTTSELIEEVLPVVSHPPSVHRNHLGRLLWDGVTDDHDDGIIDSRMAERILRPVDDVGGGLFQRSPLLANSPDLLRINPTLPGWNDSYVQRESDGNWRRLSASEYALKAPAAVQAFEKEGRMPLMGLSEYQEITPVTFTAPRPWRLTDYDARNDDAASWRNVFLCYGELLNLLREYRKRPVAAMGAAAPLYAGLADAVVLEAEQGRWPHQPFFHARRLAPLAIFYGAGAFDDFIKDPRFVEMQPSEHADRYFAQQMAYGFAGRLIPAAYGDKLRRRSYFLMAAIQPWFTEAPPFRIRWHNGLDWLRVEELSPDILDRSQLRVDYHNGLTLFVNASASEQWTVEWQEQAFTLPPFGWAAFAPDFIQIGAEYEGNRFDYIAVSHYYYFDGRGNNTSFMGFESPEPILLRRIGRHTWEAVVFGHEESVTIPPPDGASSHWDVQAWNRADELLERREITVSENTIHLPASASVWRYILTRQVTDPVAGRENDR